MTRHDHSILHRRIPVLGMAGLLAVVLGGVFLGGPAQVVEPPRSAPLHSRDLLFADMPATLAPGTGGFVRGAMRGLARDRRRNGGGGDEAPFRLAAWSDGRFTLEDTVTGHAIDLQAFGRTQAETFANMLNTRGGVR
jgi:hypothetical protein